MRTILMLAVLGMLSSVALAGERGTIGSSVFKPGDGKGTIGRLGGEGSGCGGGAFVPGDGEQSVRVPCRLLSLGAYARRCSVARIGVVSDE